MVNNGSTHPKISSFDQRLEFVSKQKFQQQAEKDNKKAFIGLLFIESYEGKGCATGRIGSGMWEVKVVAVGATD